MGERAAKKPRPFLDNFSAEKLGASFGRGLGSALNALGCAVIWYCIDDRLAMHLDVPALGTLPFDVTLFVILIAQWIATPSGDSRQ